MSWLMTGQYSLIGYLYLFILKSGSLIIYLYHFPYSLTKAHIIVCDLME